MISFEEIQQRRSPSALRHFVEHVLTTVDWRVGIQKKGLCKEFVDEIVPLSHFAVQKYPETYSIQPVLGSQGYDALVFDEIGVEVDRVEMTKPHDGAANARDTNRVLEQGFGESRVQNPGDDFNELMPAIVRACKKKAQNDYGDCTLVIAIDPDRPFPGFEALFENQIQQIVDSLRKIQFKAKRVFLLILPDRIETVHA